MLDAEKDKRFVLGIDGGGTHTAACLISTAGEFVAQMEGGPLRYAQVRERVADGIARLTDRILRSAEVPKKALLVAAVCLTGVGRESDRKIVLQALRRKKLAPKIIVDSDAIAGLTGALGLAPGIIVIAGTGSIAFARDQHGQIHRAGGWGYLIGDEGSGYAIARDGINAALKDFDGRGQKTQLRQLFEEKFRVNRIDEIISKIQLPKPDRGAIASLAPLVFGAAKNGDAVAQEIIQRAGFELGRLIAAQLSNLRDVPPPITVSFLGNLFQQKDMLMAGILKALVGEMQKIKIVEPRFPPVAGAALIALAAIDVATDEEFLKRLESSVPSAFNSHF